MANLQGALSERAAPAKDLGMARFFCDFTLRPTERLPYRLQLGDAPSGIDLDRLP